MGVNIHAFVVDADGTVLDEKQMRCYIVGIIPYFYQYAENI